MTAQGKAEKIFQAYIEELPPVLFLHEKKRLTKQCALICVEEIINNTNQIQKECLAGLSFQPNVKYWEAVKQELLKL